ncbi:MFS transporter [Levilactobacillus brevis]|nr:MFS transporter [Levilactobacillus brevis]
MSWSVAGAMVFGLLGLAFFIQRARHQEHPLIQLATVANPAFAWHLVAFFLVQITALGLSFVLPNYLQLVNQQSAFVAGLVVLPGAVVGAAFSPIGGNILDRFGAKRPILLGLGLVVITLAVMTGAATQLSVGGILGLYVGYMVGIGAAFGNIMTDGLKQLPATLKADGNALMNAMQQFAGAMGTAIVSAIIAASQASGVGSTAIKTATGSQWALLVLGIAGAGAWLSMVVAFRFNRHV